MFAIAEITDKKIKNCGNIIWFSLQSSLHEWKFQSIKWVSRFKMKLLGRDNFPILVCYNMISTWSRNETRPVEQLFSRCNSNFQCNLQNEICACFENKVLMWESKLCSQQPHTQKYFKHTTIRENFKATKNNKSTHTSSKTGTKLNGNTGVRYFPASFYC